MSCEVARVLSYCCRQRIETPSVQSYRKGNYVPDVAQEPIPLQSPVVDLIEELAGDENNTAEIRLRSAKELGSRRSLSTFGHTQAAMRISIAYEDGIAQYKK